MTGTACRSERRTTGGRDAFHQLLSGQPAKIETVANEAGLGVGAAQMAEVNDGSIIGMDGLTTRPTPVRKFVEGGFMEATLAARWGIRQTLGTYVGATSANRGHARGR
jgi:hypothetical protein